MTDEDRSAIERLKKEAPYTWLAASGALSIYKKYNLWSDPTDQQLADFFIEESAAAGPIKIWTFANAPAELRALSEHGGDEDWLALIPKGQTDSWVAFWIQSAYIYGVDKYPLPNGDMVYIGAHA